MSLETSPGEPGQGPTPMPLGSPFPISFHLEDRDHQSTLYITDDPGGQELRVEITNVSGRTITLDPFGSTPPDAGHFHFELRFRPGTLSSGAIQGMTVTEADAVSWRCAAPTVLPRGVALFVQCGKPTTLEPGGVLAFTLRNVGADAVGGARNTRVELHLGALRFQGETTTLPGYRTQLLSILGRRGLGTAPLQVGFVGSSTVLVDTVSAATLTLRIANLLADGNLVLDANPAAPTRLVLSFDVQSEPRNPPSGLGSSSQVADIAVLPSGRLELDVRKVVSGETPEWIITPKTTQVLGPKAFLEFTLQNVVAAPPSGPSPLYLRYQNLPGYWDGQFVCVIEKGPVHFLDDRVGIGTLRPRTALDTARGVLSGAANDYLKAQFHFSGGGTVTWQGPGKRLNWTQRFIAISMERGSTFADGHLQIDPPKGPIPVYDGTTRDVDATGVLLKEWEALYAVHTVGGGKADVSLRIESWMNPQAFHAPSHWLPVAVVNGDDGSVRLGTGAILPARSSLSRGGTIPCGSIVMWSGNESDIPEGWALCDGRDAGGVRTPDLRGRFVVGAPGAYPPHQKGGDAGVTLSVDNLPPHTHPASAAASGAHIHQVPFDTGGGGDYGAPVMAKVGDPSSYALANFSTPTTQAGEHSHTIQVGTIGGGKSFAAVPPYWALCFIMKVF